ncbi:cytochrome P450 [Nocardia sp. NPDC052278]|uniref:cytochrome P450 n=1 Tax=unclassified Nocardia TaxID=2637762 RepID=UPI003677F48A
MSDTHFVTGTDPTRCPAFPMPRSTQDPLAPPPGMIELRDHARISRVRLWDGSTPWLITGYDDQRKVLSDDRFSADIRLAGFPQSSPATATWFERARPLMTMDDPEHSTLRRTMAGAFTIRRVESLRDDVATIVDGLIDRMLEAGPPVDLVGSFSHPIPSLVICRMLSVPFDDHEFFQATAKTVVSTSSSAAESSAAIISLRDYMADLIRSVADNPPEGLLGALIEEQYRAGRYTLSETAAIALQLLLAGHDTTASMISLGVLALLRHPGQFQRLVTSAGRQPWVNAVEELLRFLTIVHTGRRRVALTDVEVCGQLIKAGEGIIAASDVSNREAGIFGDPDRLDVSREARHHLSFGFGIHQCLGAPLARMEMQEAYSRLLQRIPTLELAVAPEELTFRDSAVVYGVDELPVTWKP